MLQGASSSDSDSYSQDVSEWIIECLSDSQNSEWIRMQGRMEWVQENLMKNGMSERLSGHIKIEWVNEATWLKWSQILYVREMKLNPVHSKYLWLSEKSTKGEYVADLVVHFKHLSNCCSRLFKSTLIVLMSLSPPFRSYNPVWPKVLLMRKYPP